MSVSITHVVFKIAGEASQLAAFDARLKLLFAEYRIGDEVEEQHSADALHYDLKVAGGIPFPPFALASRDFPELVIAVEWVDAASGVRGAATIVAGALTEQKIDQLAATRAGHAVSIRTEPNGYLALGIAAVRTGPEECRGYVLTGSEDALFLIMRDSTGAIDLLTTEGAAEWRRAWHLPRDGEPAYRTLEPAQPIADRDFQELEKIAQDFVAQWIWFGDGPREEIVIEVERYERLGYEVSAANLRSAALHRIRGGNDTAEGIRYTELDAEIEWVEEAIARCWPRED